MAYNDNCVMQNILEPGKVVSCHDGLKYTVLKAYKNGRVDLIPIDQNLKKEVCSKTSKLKTIKKQTCDIVDESKYKSFNFGEIKRLIKFDRFQTILTQQLDKGV
jgi:hypothetical protein